MAAVQFMNADAAAQATMAARSAGAPRPLRASPRASTEKMIMAASSARACTWAAVCSCFWEKMNAYWAAYTTYSRPASSRARSAMPALIRPRPGSRGRLRGAPAGTGW